MITLDLEQGSPEWLQARAGIPSASNFDSIITSTGLKSKTWQSYLNKLIVELVLGPQEQFESEAMLIGAEKEKLARLEFTMDTGLEVEQVGFCLLDNKSVGCSPDGLIGKDSGIEIKCPLAHTHIGYLRADKLPAKYIQQVQGAMYVTGRKSWYFVSFFPDLPSLILKIDRDDVFIQKLHDYLIEFTKELHTAWEKIK